MLDMDLNYRFEKIDDAIQKLASVSTDISKLIAVNDQRIIQQEKSIDYMSDSADKRRDEVDTTIEKLYVVMDERDNKILEEIKEMRKEASGQHMFLDRKISKLEKIIWMAIGAGAVLGYLIDYSVQYFIRIAPLIPK